MVLIIIVLIKIKNSFNKNCLKKLEISYKGNCLNNNSRNKNCFKKLKIVRIKNDLKEFKEVSIKIVWIIIRSITIKNRFYKSDYH